MFIIFHTQVVESILIKMGMEAADNPDLHIGG